MTPEQEQQFDTEFSHSDECNTLRFQDFETEPFADCYCTLKVIKSFINTIIIPQTRAQERERIKTWIASKEIELPLLGTPSHKLMHEEIKYGGYNKAIYDFQAFLDSMEKGGE